MTSDEVCRRFAYNTWANRRLLDAIRVAPEAAFARRLAGGIGSIRSALVHAMAGEWKWLRCWRGEPSDHAVAVDDYSTVSAIEHRWAEIASGLQTFAEGITDDQLRGTVRARGRDHALADSIHHLLDHSSYQRGQVVALLGHAGFGAPPADFLAFMSDRLPSTAGTLASAVRTASVADAGTIASLLVEAFGEFEPLYTPAGYRATTPTPGELQQRFTDGPVWVAEHGGQIAGTVSAVVHADGVHVRGMAVSPSARGYGLGRLLLDHVQDFAAEQARHRLYLSTTPFLASAIRLYEQAGFVRTSAPPYELFGTALFTMEKWSDRANVR